MRFIFGMFLSAGAMAQPVSTVVATPADTTAHSNAQHVVGAAATTWQTFDTLAGRVRIGAELGGLAATGGRTPFWLRANRFGAVPLNSPFGFARLLSAGQTKGGPDGRGWRVGYSLDVVANAAQPARVLVPEAHVRVAYRRMEFFAGRRKEVHGLVDTLLTSGSYAWSGNALPIPKLQIGTNGFAPLRFTRDLIALNGFYAHGWFANTDSIQNSFLHQKALYGRIGRPHWKIKLYGGLLHNAQWGGRSATLPPTVAPNGQIPSSLQAYTNVVLIRQPGSADPNVFGEFDRVNRVGNHVGSVDVAMEIERPRGNFLVYLQRPFEDQSGFALQNWPDGLYGLRWQNRTPTPLRSFRVLRLTTELLTTLSQSGFQIKRPGSKYDGADDYFNNFQYRDGWTYQERVLGTPFITRWQDTRPELADLRGGTRKMAINGNRVRALHVGMLGQWPSGATLRVQLTMSRHYGRPARRDPRSPFDQFSGLAELTWPMRGWRGAEICAAVAADQGGWLPASVGGWFSFRKTGWLR